MFHGYYQNKRVLVTGHTGFKGSWMAEWLLMLGAEVHGFALDPQDHELLHDQLGLSSRLASDTRADLRDPAAIRKTVYAIKPDVVIHLAAQPLVRLSYDVPIETFATNIMGTAHVLEAVRQTSRPCTVVCVTTDKCYENREWLHAYREDDAMGGHDPYSASKGAAELVIASYRKSFFNTTSPVRIASARAGNVIGGGDWAIDRIVPDVIRAVRADQPIPVRNKIATRPWQHVLEPLGGYLLLAASLAQADPFSSRGRALSGAFNFGPSLGSNRTVVELVEALIRHTGGEWTDTSSPDAVHEATKLNLAIDKAFHLLQWMPAWDFEQTIGKTAEWYLAEASGKDILKITRAQIECYNQVAAL